MPIAQKQKKRIIFLRILARGGDYSKTQEFPGTREGKVCSMKVANHTPATPFGVTQQIFSRHRATSKPPMRNSTDAQIMRMCADNAPSACIMHGCVFCADYAQMRMVRMVRMCACAVLRSRCRCVAWASAMCAAAQNAQRQSPSRENQKRIIFLRILEQEGETSKNQ